MQDHKEIAFPGFEDEREGSIIELACRRYAANKVKIAVGVKRRDADVKIAIERFEPRVAKRKAGKSGKKADVRHTVAGAGGKRQRHRESDLAVSDAIKAEAVIVAKVVNRAVAAFERRYDPGLRPKPGRRQPLFFGPKEKSRHRPRRSALKPPSLSLEDKRRQPAPVGNFALQRSSGYSQAATLAAAAFGGRLPGPDSHEIRSERLAADWVFGWAKEGSPTMVDEGRALRVILAQPRGFCAGVERAIDIVERALEKYGAPVYVRHEIVHNKRVVDTLRDRGAIFVEEIDEIPTGAVTIFSAHGVSQKVEGGATLRDLDVIDATCPLVTKVHKEGRRYAEKGYDIVLIGHLGHPEVEGTLGQIPGVVHVISEPMEVEGLNVRDAERVAFVTQTTLSVNDTKDVIAALRSRFPSIVGPDTRDICYATQNRQTAVIELCKQVDLLLVVGAHNSSNSNRLREIGENFGIPAYLIEDAGMLNLDWIKNVGTVGVTAGASAPETLVQETIAKLRSIRDVSVETLDGVRENVHFKLPSELADVPRPKAALDAWAVETA